MHNTTQTFTLPSVSKILFVLPEVDLPAEVLVDGVCVLGPDGAFIHFGAQDRNYVSGIIGKLRPGQNDFVKVH